MAHTQQPKNEVSVTISNRTILRVAAITVGIVILLMAIQRASHALILIFTAFFLALALNGPVFWIGRHLPGKLRGSRSLATTLSFLIVILLIGIFTASVVPPLVRQTQTFAKAAPSLIRDFRSQDSEVGSLIRKYHLEDQVNNVSSQLSTRIKASGGSAFSTFNKIGSSVFSMVTILVITFMMLVEGPRWLRLGRQMVPERHHKMADGLVADMYKVIKGYVNGQVFLAALAAFFIMIPVVLLGVSYPAAIFVIIFVCGLIPMVGHTIGALIVSAIALFHSAGAAFFILGYYILYQQIENYSIQPRIQANSTNMSPLLVFVSVIIGVSFNGILGGLVAIPIAGCIRIALLQYLHYKSLISAEFFKDATTAETK